MVRYGELHPAEFCSRLDESPIAYLPVGSLEWHSYHLPYGVDTMKAERVCELAAERYGGIVLPGLPWGAMHGSWRDGTHPGLSEEVRVALYTEIFAGLVEVGFRVLVAVSGHWTGKQTSSLRTAIERVSQPGRVTGFATFDGSDPCDGFDPHEELGMDHAGAWETSIMMAIRPDIVRLGRLADADLSDLPGEECHLTASGIQGESPIGVATAERGEAHTRRVARLVGEHARELLATVATGGAATTA